MPIDRVVIVHGYAANPSMHWFRDLANFLQKSCCVDVLIPQMPRPYLPDIKSWKHKLLSMTEGNRENTAIIGHSFGGISALRTAENFATGPKLGAIIIVASPVKWIWHPSFPARIFFWEPDWNRVLAGTNNIALVYSTNDKIVPFNNATYLQSKLECELFVLHGYGHILCPALDKEVKKFITFTLGFG